MKSNEKTMPERDSVLSSLEYDPSTGVLRWKAPRQGIKIGQVAGYTEKDGYVYIHVCRRRYLAHRLAWLVAYGKWPKGDLDHINGVRDDNRISNLRLATRSQNIANSKRSKKNTSGFKGVSRKRRKLWRAMIRINYKRIHLGHFKTVEEAHAAYCEAAIKYFGQFARAG